jgi:hypothetical protein
LLSPPDGGQHLSRDISQQPDPALFFSLRPAIIPVIPSKQFAGISILIVRVSFESLVFFS